MDYRTDSMLPGIKVVGVGGGGCNAVNRMIRAKIPGVRFLALNTDAQALMASEAETRLRIGEKLTKGLGVGGDPTRGERAADESRDEIYELIRGAEMVFVTAGMGGGTGTGAAPVVAEIAKDCGALTIGVVTKPFAFEGARRAKAAEDGIARLKDKVDTLIAIPNARLLEVCPPNATFEEACLTADDVLRQAIQSISNVISQSGTINLDFNDVRAVMCEAGPALLGVGSAEGENRAVVAAKAATESVLLGQSIQGARSVLLNITHSGKIGLKEIDEAGRAVAEMTDPSVNLIFGTVVDPSAGDAVHVTIIATGFPPKEQRMAEARATAGFGVFSLPGNAYGEDAEVPSFLRKNRGGLNAGPGSLNIAGTPASATLAERR